MPIQIKNEAGETIDFDPDQYADDLKAHYEGKGVIFKTAADIEADKKAIEKQTADDVSKKVHGDWEGELAKILGQRPDGVKGIEWAKGSVADLAEKAKKAATPPAPSTADEVTKEQLRKNQEELEALKKTIEEKESKSKDAAIKTGLKSSVKTLKLAGETPEEKKATGEALEKLISSSYKLKFDEEDNLVIFDGDTPVLDPETGNSPMTIEKLAATKYKYFLASEKVEDKKKPVGGTGTQPADVVKDNEGKDGMVAKSVDEIRDKCAKLGYPIGSPEYKSFMETSLKLSKLEQD